jgi:hypothetical protein
MHHSRWAAFKLFFCAAAALPLLAATACEAEPAGVRLDCKLGYDALLKDLKTRQDLQMDDYPFGIEFHKKGPDGGAYYFTKTPHAAHPAIFWYGKGSSCQAIKADGCGFGNADRFKNALGKFQGRGANGC